MNSKSFHDFINFDVVYYFFELTRRITTMNDKIHVIEFNHFIKLFFYSIQNRDNDVIEIVNVFTFNSLYMML